MKCFFLSMANFILFCSVNAQNIPIRTTVKTPGGNMTTTHYMNMPRNYNSGVEMRGHDYKIKLINDSLITKYTRISIDDSVHYIKFKKNKKEFLIKPSHTKELKFTTSSGYTYTGIPKDSCWMFKMRSGKISTYSYVPEFELIYLIAIQKENGEIISYTKDNVLKLVEGNEEATKYAHKDKLYKALCVYNGWTWN